MDPDADPGGPKTYGSYGSGYGSATLVPSKQKRTETRLLSTFKIFLGNVHVPVINKSLK
jgi:hypothetical protein